MSKRIYLVGGKHLVRAHSPAGARNFIASRTVTSELASQDTLVKLLSEGAVVEDSAAPETKDAFEENTKATGEGEEVNGHNTK